jgi:hypothetical protein
LGFWLDMHDRLAQEGDSSLAVTLDTALKSLRRQQFYEAMEHAKAQLRSDPVAWDVYVRDHDAWLKPDS